jgi:hypothetical protein
MSRLAALVLVALGCTSASPPPAAVPAPATPPAVIPAPPPPPAAIRADDMRRDLTIFASDGFRGRETGTADIVRAAEFIAERLAALGLEPAGDSGFFARVPTERQAFGPGTRVTVSMRGEATPRTLGIGPDVLPLLELSPSLPPPKTRADAELVFGGYGPMPALGRNDLAGLDIGGKAVVLINGAPPVANATQKAELESAEQVGNRLQEALSRRPAAVILLLTGASEELYMQLLPGVLRSASLVTDRAEVPEDARPLPLVLIGRVRPGSPFLPEGWPADDRPQVLAGRRLSAQLDVRRERFTGYNIVAIARGTDAALNRSYVAYGAHYDHVGVLPAVDGDSIANGADDDGSGSVALLEIARAFRERPARRSALFVWHTGEEKGLLGSEYFTNHATVPVDSIVAQLNADMIGRNAPALLYVVGPAAAPNGQSRALGRMVDSVNATLPTPFTFNREWDSPTHPEHIYERSDHFNYAQKGIPIVFFTTGLHDEYHTVSDEVGKIDFAKMSRVAELMFRTGQAVGNRTTRPR